MGEDNCNVVWMVVLFVGFFDSVLGIIVNCFCVLGMLVIVMVV